MAMLFNTSQFAAALDLDLKLSFLEMLLLSVIGFSIVFLVLIAIMAIIKLIANFGEKKKAIQEAPAPAAPAAVKQAPIERSVGEIELNGVDAQTAVRLMALVASKLDVPLNEIRFISIREA